MTDSLRAKYGQVVLADGGGYFPEDPLRQDAAWFLMDAMMLLGTDAVGVGDRDLKFGLSYLRENVKRSRLPAVSANLAEKPSGKLVFPATRVVQKGTVKVGFFGLLSDKADLGVSRDSLQALDPSAAARKAVAELRKQGATVVVVLSDLGKVESEDLATNVDGIDVVIAGRNVPMIQKGRQLKNTLVVYGGEKGQHVGRALVALDQARRPVSMEADVHVLGPEYRDQPEMATLAKSFRETLNEKVSRAHKEAAAARALASAENSPDRFVGMEVCARCHPAETAQWKGTAHAKAWQTLVDAKKDADPACVSCHVVGYQKAGGFQTAAVTPAMTNVQCESCHGMGTQHEAFTERPRRITEATCRTCHNPDNSPEFSFALYQAHVVHKTPANLPPLPKTAGMKKAMGAKVGGGK